MAAKGSLEAIIEVAKYHSAQELNEVRDLLPSKGTRPCQEFPAESIQNESRHTRWWTRNANFRRNTSQAKAHDRNRRASDSLAHYENVFRTRRK